jgi:ligand-binding sensor domain-containing protein
MKKIWLVSFLILAPTLRAFPPSPVERILSSGQDQPAWPSQYGIDFWREGEGLTQSRIRSILQTRDGYLWLATDNGLVRFNGTSFTAFTIQTDSLEDNEVRALIEDNEGGLWIGTVGGLTLFKDGRFKTFRVSDGLPSDMISKLEKDLEGNIWMATAGGVIRFSQGRFTTFTTRQGLSHNFVRAVAAGPAGVFAANATSLHRYENGRFVALGGVVKSSDGRINDLLCSREGSVWISCENGVIKKLKDGSLVTFSKKGDLGSGTNYLYEDRQGTLWVASPRGLLRLQADRFAAVPFDSAKRLGVVYSVCADREGSLWIGLESGGLARLRVNRVRTLAGEDGLASDSTRSVFEDSRGAIWVGTVTGFAELSEGRVSNYTTIEGVPIGPVKSFAEDGSGGVWIGARQSVLIMEHGRLHRLAGWPLTVEIRVIYRDARNRMWIGTDGDGLFCVDNGRITHLGPRDGLPGGQIRAVHLDRRGVLWVATAGGGVVRYESGHFKSYGIADGLAGDRVLDIHEDDEGALWFATRGGLTRFKNNKFFSYGARNGLLESFVYAILDDDLGNFWFSSASGIFRVSKAELRDFANGRIKEVRSTDYGERDGMNTRACNAGNWPVAWKTADGRLLFCSMKGIVIVTPGHLFRNTIAPPEDRGRGSSTRLSAGPSDRKSSYEGRREDQNHDRRGSFRCESGSRVDHQQPGRYDHRGGSREWPAGHRAVRATPSGRDFDGPQASRSRGNRSHCRYP